jgi:hypothetical protein
MSSVTIFIPISRPEHLDRLFHSLEVLDCDAEQTNLLTYVDGDQELFLKTRNLTQQSKFVERLCVHRGVQRRTPQFGLRERRKRIAAIKNESKTLIGECDYIFGIEDDTIVPSHALAQLLSDYASYPHAGFIEGVELGRWGIPYVGAWRADDVYEPTKIESLMPGHDVEEIDAGGFYCYLTRRDLYISHEYKPFGYNDLGPDVDYGLYLRRNGYKNYIDWRVKCEHRMKGGMAISLSKNEPRQVAMIKEGDTWKQKLA